jgi:hypothetical protein
MKDGERRECAGTAAYHANARKMRSVTRQRAGLPHEPAANSCVTPNPVAPSPEPAPSLDRPRRDTDQLERAKNRFEIAKSIVTIAAILSGALWFVLQGQHRARLKVHNEITHRRITEDTQLLAVDTVVSNVGNVRADISCTNVWVDKVLPKVGASKLVYPPFDECTAQVTLALEPGEEYAIHTEHTLYDEVITVRVASIVYLDVRPDYPIGYESVKLYDLEISKK